MLQLIYFFILLKIFIITKINCSKEVDKKLDKKRELEEGDSFHIYIDKYYLNESLYDPSDRIKFEIYSTALDKAKAALKKLIELTENTKVNIENYYVRIKDNFHLRDGDFDPELKNKAKEANLIIFVKQKSSLNEESFIGECNEYSLILDFNKTRPTIGAIIIDGDYYSKSFKDDNEKNEYKIEFYSYYFLHQMTHILGFNRTILNGTVDFVNKTITRISSNPGIQRETINCKNQNCNLMKFAKKYFNCPNITYLELEESDNNGKCSDYIHWDTRILLGDYMTKNFYIQDQVISEFTLYLLEETGFYKINKYTGGLMRFGKNANCSFFNMDCNVQKSEYSDAQLTRRNSLFPNEFCSSRSKTTCSSGRLSRGLCENIIGGGSTFNLDPYRRNDWDDYGNKYAEYCPISIEETNLRFEADGDNNYQSYKGNCKIGTNKDFGIKIFYMWRDITDNKYNYSLFSNDYGEIFSDTSFCAFSSVIHKNDKNKKYYD